MSKNLGLTSELQHLSTVRAKAAFENIYKTYQGKLLHIAVIIVKDTSVAEEVVNDTFLKLWKNRANITDDQHILGFLIVALRFACINTVKKLTRENRIPDNIQNDIEQAAVFPYLHKLDILKRFLAIAETMPPQTRKVFLLHIQGKNNEQIAKLLGINLSTVKTQNTRARKIIYENLDNPSDRDAYLMLLFIYYVGISYSA